jgi:hypothetical protein
MFLNAKITNKSAEQYIPLEYIGKITRLSLWPLHGTGNVFALLPVSMKRAQ